MAFEKFDKGYAPNRLYSARINKGVMTMTATLQDEIAHWQRIAFYFDTETKQIGMECSFLSRDNLITRSVATVMIRVMKLQSHYKISDGTEYTHRVNDDGMIILTPIAEAGK